MICFFKFDSDRQKYVCKFDLKRVLELWDEDIFDITASFWTNDAPHLWSNLQTPNFFFGKKSLNVLNVKLFSKFFFQHFGAPFDGFLFQTLIKGKYFSICWPVTCYCLKMATKLAIIQNLLRNKRCFTNWTIYDLQHQFN